MSDVIAALEQVYLIRGAFLMAAVNLSIVGTPRNSACDGNPMKGVIDNLRSVAIATVAAAGNNGAIGIAEPACISTVVSVGATSKSDAVPLFSNTASFLSLLAPGVSITSSVPGGGFRSMDGTSMAAPHVAGAFAILRQASPAASVSELLSALQATGVPIADPGAGGLVKPRIRIAAALAALGVPTSPRSLFIRGFYQNVLARAAEPAGLAAWDAFLAGNCNAAGFAAIAVGFFDSTEFRTVRPLTLDGLVTVLYRTFLARDPEPQGLAAWADGFRQARLALAVQGFIPSPEFQGLLPNRGEAGAVAAVITRLYVEILGRQPEPQGLAAWVSYVVASRDLEGAAVGFLVSAEFERRPLTFRDYVAVLYRAFLGRAPAPSEIDAWEPLLRTYLLQVIEAGFIPSAEFQGKIPEVCG